MTALFKVKNNYLYLPLLCFVALLFPFTAAANNEDGGELDEYVKTYQDDFRILSDGSVELFNRHGRIHISHNDGDEVEVKVKVVVQARSQESANRIFDRINIDMDGRSDRVKVQTNIESGRGWNDGDFEIIYDIRLPSSVSLNVDAKHCDLIMDDHLGEVELKVKYGDLRAQTLGARSNIYVGYGSANIDQLGDESRITVTYGEIRLDGAQSLELELRYSEGTLGDIDNLILDTRYDEVEINSADNLMIDAGYTDFEIGSVNNLRARSNYSEYNIGTVSGNVDIETGYGDVEIDRLEAGFQEIKIRGNYSDVEMSLQSGTGYSFSGRASHGDVSVPGGFSVARREKEGHSESIEGTFAGNGQGTIRISTNYGDIDVR